MPNPENLGRASISSTDQKGRFPGTLLRFTQCKLVWGGIRSTVASTRFHMTGFKADPTRNVHLVGGTRISPSNSRTSSDQVSAAPRHQEFPDDGSAPGRIRTCNLR